MYDSDVSCVVRRMARCLIYTLTMLFLFFFFAILSKKAASPAAH